MSKRRRAHHPKLLAAVRQLQARVRETQEHLYESAAVARHSRWLFNQFLEHIEDAGWEVRAPRPQGEMRSSCAMQVDFPRQVLAIRPHVHLRIQQAPALVQLALVRQEDITTELARILSLLERPQKKRRRHV